MADPRAREIAEILTECEIPSHTQMHAAQRSAHLEIEARMVERVAALSGVSLDQLAARLEDGRLTAETAMAGLPERAES